MRRLVHRSLAAGSLVLLAGLAGCGGPSKPKMRDIPPPPLPPRVPSAEEVRLDPALRQSARDVILAGLTSPNELTRSHALEAIGDIAQSDPGGPDYSPYIIKGLKDQEELVRFSAAMTAGKLRMAAARDALVGDLYDHSAKVRVAVRYALHMLGDKSHSHDLEALSRDSDPTVRGAVAEVLGQMNEPSAVKILRPMRFDGDARVRDQVAEALWRLGDEDGRNELIALTVSSFADDRMFGVIALAEGKNVEVREAIRADLCSEWTEVNVTAARAMGMLGSDEGYTIAIQAAQNYDASDRDHAKAASYQRFLAAVALGAIGRSDAQPVLAKLLQDRSASTRMAAAVAILQLHQ